MKTIRSFIAIPLAPDVERSAAQLIRQLSEQGDDIRWVPTDNLHLTLKFLGEVDNTEVPQVCKVCRQVCSRFPPFELRFGGTGGLPSLDKPRVLFAGVRDPSGSLTEIVPQLERALAEMGFKPEPRDYTPHLTLGRTKSGRRKASDDVIQRVKDQQSIDLGSMYVDTVQLIASFLDKQGPTYQVMDTIELLTE